MFASLRNFKSKKIIVQTKKEKTMNATAVKTEPRTRTEKRMFNGRKVELNFKEEKLISVTADGKETRICKSEYKTLIVMDNVKFKIPEHSLDTKIVPPQSQFTIEDNSLVEKLITAYFRAGIFFKSGHMSKLITRNFFDQSKNPLNIPFGKIVLGTIEIQKCITHTGEERIIIDYHIGRIYDHKKDGQFKWKEIKFLSELPEKYDFSFNLFPGQKNTTYIVVK